MGNKYNGLSNYLAERRNSRWDASFADIEAVLGSALPDSARRHQAWWANQMRGQSLSWQSVGWRSTELDLANQRVVFIREAEPRKATGSSRLSISEAKAGLAQTFGVDPDQIEITIKG